MVWPDAIVMVKPKVHYASWFRTS